MSGIFVHDFMRHALLAATALSLLCGLVGYYLVLRHEAFTGESLSDIAFTGALGFAVVGFSPLAGMFGATVGAAAGMAALGKRLRERDVTTGVVLASVLGLGVLFLSLFSRGAGRNTGMSGTSVLFGGILSITESQAWLLTAVAAVIAAAVITISKPLFFASVDPEVAAARGVHVRTLGFVYTLLLAVTVVEAVQAVGVLLVFALLLLPAAAAHELTTRRDLGLALAAALTIASTWTGLVVGYYSGLPISVCISLLAFAVYAVAAGGRRALRMGRG